MKLTDAKVPCECKDGRVAVHGSPFDSWEYHKECDGTARCWPTDLLRAVYPTTEGIRGRIEIRSPKEILDKLAEVIDT